MTASRSNKRSAWVVPTPRNTRVKSNQPEQLVPARQECAGLPQESPNDSGFKTTPFAMTDVVSAEDWAKAPEFVKSDEFDRVYILDPSTTKPLNPSSKEVNTDGVFVGTDGDRHHYVYGDLGNSHPSDSDEEDLDYEETKRDQEFTRTCIKVLANCLARRLSRAMIDLIGIEPNPGPKGKMGLNQGTMKSIISSLGLNQSKNGKKKQKSKRKSRSDNSARPANTTKMSGVPAAFGMIAPRAYFSMRGVAQKLADQDSLNSVRAEGCALMSTGITINPSVSSNVTGALNSPLVQDNGFLNVTPSSVDPRLNALAQTFQYYAFRRLVLKYIPFTGTTTQGGLYLAIGKDADQVDENFNNVTPGASGFSGGTPQNVMEYDPSLMTAIWQPAALTFRHTGTELWQTFPNGEEPTNERIQASVVSLFEGPPGTPGTPVTFGHLWLEYEIDFYVPGPPLSSSSGSGGSLFRSFAAPGSATIPQTPSSPGQYTIANIEANDSITSPVLVSFGFQNNGSSSTNVNLVALDTSTGVSRIIGDSITTAANSVISAAIPFLMEAGKQYLFRLIASTGGQNGAATNIFVKSV